MRDRSPPSGESGQRRDPTLREAKRRAIRPYRLALFASLALNALLVGAFWLYVHFAGTVSMIQDIVGWFE